MLTLLIVVAVAAVLIKAEAAISASVHAYFDGTVRLLTRVLDLWPQRNDGACRHMQRQNIQWRIHVKPLVTRHLLSCPEVVPRL